MYSSIWVIQVKCPNLFVWIFLFSLKFAAIYLGWLKYISSSSYVQIFTWRSNASYHCSTLERLKRAYYQKGGYTYGCSIQTLNCIIFPSSLDVTENIDYKALIAFKLCKSTGYILIYKLLVLVILASVIMFKSQINFSCYGDQSGISSTIRSR